MSAPLPPSTTDRERLLDLLLAAADGPLSPADAAELSRRGVTPEAADDRRLMAALELALLDVDAAGPEPLPAHVRDRLLVTGGLHAAAASSAAARQSTVALPAPIQTFRPAPAPRGPVVLARLGWLAAAAAVALAALAWWPGRGTATPGGPAPLASLERQVDSAADKVSWPFAGKVEEFQAAGGEVVWSDALQRGYMRLKNLAANDPAKAQYQLWIVDPSRSKEPVDGGVFDIAPGSAGEVIVPIDAKLRINQPAAFAITREKPGGVVVSAGPLLVVAVRG